MFEYFVLFLLFIIVCLLIYNRYNPIVVDVNNVPDKSDKNINVYISRFGVPNSYVSNGPVRWYNRFPRFPRRFY